MSIRARLRHIEKRVVPRVRPRGLKVHYIFGSDFIPRDMNRKPILETGEHESETLIIHVVDLKTEARPVGAAVVAEARPGICPSPGNGGGDVTTLEAEIKKLELRKRELQGKARR